MKPVIAAKAKENQLATLKQNIDPVSEISRERGIEEVQPLSPKRENRTDAQIAQAAGVSENTIRKVEKIEAQASPEIKAALRAGDLSINAAYNKVQQAEITAQVTDEPLPEQPKTKLEVAIDGTFGGGNFRQCPRRYRPTSTENSAHNASK